MSAATSASGGEPPREPPKPPKKPTSEYDWTETNFDDCLAYNRKFYCTCRQCRLYFSKSKPTVCIDPYVLEIDDTSTPRFSYLGFVNARRAAAARREADRQEARLAAIAAAARAARAEAKATKKESVPKKTSEPKNKNDDRKEKRD